MTLPGARTTAVLAALVLALFVGALLMQHFRHGWPFSLHHGLGEPPVVPAAPIQAGGVAPAHPRAEVELDKGQLDTIGARVEKVRLETLSEPIRAVATIVPDESRVSHVHTRVSGWIERLYVSTTGEPVRAGQPLAGIFSQELLASQTEYLAARRGASAGPRSAIADGARSRLKVLGMTDGEIRAIEDAGQARRLVTVTSPRSGVVLRRGISVGTAVDPSTEIVTVADLSRVWVLAEVPEGHIPGILVGTPAHLEFPASERGPIDAKVEFLYPTLSERTRTLRVRLPLDNPGGSLRPGLYGTATFDVKPRTALTVPRDAVVDTGNMQHVFLVAGERRFVPRMVTLGARLGERIEIKDGLVEGDPIVASGVFLIDSESRLRASGGGSGHAHGGPAKAASAPPQADGSSHAASPPGASTGHQGH